MSPLMIRSYAPQLLSGWDRIECRKMRVNIPHIQEHKHTGWFVMASIIQEFWMAFLLCLCSRVLFLERFQFNYLFLLTIREWSISCTRLISRLKSSFPGWKHHYMKITIFINVAWFLSTLSQILRMLLFILFAEIGDENYQQKTNLKHSLCDWIEMW